MRRSDGSLPAPQPDKYGRMPVGSDDQGWIYPPPPNGIPGLYWDPNKPDYKNGAGKTPPPYRGCR